MALITKQYVQKIKDLQAYVIVINKYKCRKRFKFNK